MLHCAVQELAGEPAYDVVISGLPLNNFSPGLVGQILGTMTGLLRPHGTLSFFQYVFIRRIKSAVVGRPERERLQAVGRVMDALLAPTSSAGTGSGRTCLRPGHTTYGWRRLPFSALRLAAGVVFVRTTRPQVAGLNLPLAPASAIISKLFFRGNLRLFPEPFESVPGVFSRGLNEASKRRVVHASR